MIVNSKNISIDHFHNSLLISGNNTAEARDKHLQHTLLQTNIKGEILEFGVYKGSSIRKISDYFSEQKVYGFDSFEGLPEDWLVNSEEKTEQKKITHHKGFFNVKKFPKVRKNTQLVKGFFDKSLPEWLENHDLEKICFLHIDSDLYSSAKTIFDCLNSYIVPGTIILFDEMYPWGDYKKYDLWEEGEWKALYEWVREFDREFEVLSRNNHQQCSIKVVR